MLLATLLFSNSAIVAQNEMQPKVGLVLSGGGAKGFAHIGTLKVIDSLGIKIDYIAGTSMGAIIGSLYASGYSGKELEVIFKTIDFDVLINDKYPRASQSFFERSNSEKYALNLPFDNFKITLPSALSRGQNVYNLLHRLMLPINEIKDFQKLPIPFFCVATNIETGAPVFLEKGNLAEAVAASGALPSLFQPVTIGNTILIDGGVTNNFPVEELRAKGMDIVIGVDVQDDLRNREYLKSAPEILMQINNFRTINAMKDKVALTDIYIKPDISNFSVVSFSEGKDIIKNGENAARYKLEDLVAVSEKQSNDFQRPKIIATDSLTIANIGFKGNERYTRSYLKGKLKLKGNEKISYTDLEKGIINLVATNNFDTFRYQLIPVSNEDSYNLLVNVKESESTASIKFGVHYDGLYKSAALANFTKKKLFFNNDIASLDLILGDNSRYNFNYFIDKGFYVSIGINSRFYQFNKNINLALLIEEGSSILTEVNRIDAELQDFTNQIFIQTLFRKDFALRLGGEHKRLNITSETLFSENQEDDIIFEKTDYLSVFGNLKYDSYSNRYFPKSGFYFDGNFQLYLHASSFNADFSEFSIAKADIGYAFSIKDKLAFNVSTQGGFKIGDDSTTALGFALGGYAHNFINNFESFYGYDYISLTGDSFVKANFRLDYEVIKKHHILIEANYANIENSIFETGEWITSPDYSGYALGYAIETFIGPIEAKYTYSPETGNGYWFFNLGFWF